MRNNVPTADFSYNLANPNFIAGIRPFRKDTYRLESEKYDQKLIVHNYGHGGSGVTMSWGCALEVRDIIGIESKKDIKPSVAIIGGGVVGLSSAHVLSEAGYEVSVYTKDTTPKTTSNVAAAQWAPSIINYRNSEQEKFHRILRRSFEAFSNLSIDATWGISRKSNYTWKRSPSFDRVPRDVIGEPDYFEVLPFNGIEHSGYRYKTLLIETQLFMPRLVYGLNSNGVSIRLKEFANIGEILKLNEDVVVNCTGLGSEFLFGDDKLMPIKGSLALLRPQPNLDYLFSGNGYIFPRQDLVVLGGTAERGVYDPTPDPSICKGIIDYHRSVFELGDESLIQNVPDIYDVDF